MTDFPVLIGSKREGVKQCLEIQRRFLRWQTIFPKEKKEQVMFFSYYTSVVLEHKTHSKQSQDTDSQHKFHSTLTSRWRNSEKSDIQK